MASVPPRAAPDRQSRKSEDHLAVSIAAQKRALPASDAFWAVAEVFPNNTIAFEVEDADGNRPEEQPVLNEGAPIHYPDYLMFYLVCTAGIPGIGTYRRAVAEVQDLESWASLVHHMDQMSPAGYTELAHLPYPQRRNDAKKRAAGLQPRAIAVAQTSKTSTASTRATNTGEPVRYLYPVPKSLPPAAWHLDYFVKRMRGLDYKGNPLPRHDPYHDMQTKMMLALRAAGMTQASHGHPAARLSVRVPQARPGPMDRCRRRRLRRQRHAQEGHPQPDSRPLLHLRWQRDGVRHQVHDVLDPHPGTSPLPRHLRMGT